MRVFFILLDKDKILAYNSVAFKSVIRSRERRETVNEESPNFLETGCRRNPGEGDFKESATENNRRYFGKDEKAW